jgi:sugar-specific transcriptional regulator TrmB
MDRDQLRAALENADLTGYQAEAYLTLVDEGMIRAIDVAKKSEVPTSQIYEILRDLEEQGFIETIEQDQLHARARDPTEMLDHLRTRGELLTAAAEEIEDRWERPKMHRHRISFVRNTETVLQHVRESLANAETNVDVALSFDQLQTLAPALAEAKRRGVIIRCVVYPEPDLASKLENLGLDEVVGELRVHDIPSAFLTIVDRRQIFFAPNSRADEPYGILFEDEILAYVHYWYFETCLWTLSEPVFTDPAMAFVYVSIEQFIRDMTVPWNHGADISVTVYGEDVHSGESRVLSGRLVDVIFPGVARTDDAPPTFDQLGGISSLVVESDGETYSVGGSGAVYEDLKGTQIVVEDVEFEPPGETDPWPTPDRRV